MKGTENRKPTAVNENKVYGQEERSDKRRREHNMMVGWENCSLNGAHDASVRPIGPTMEAQRLARDSKKKKWGRKVETGT
jgi:hypothetical protein